MSDDTNYSTSAMLILLFLAIACGIVLGMVIGTLLPNISSNPIDITTNVTSVSIDSNGKAILNTEVGDFRFVGRKTSSDVDFMISNSIPKCEPLVLHIEDGYVRSYKKVYPTTKGC